MSRAAPHRYDPVMDLTQTLTAQYEHERQRSLDGLTPAERGANALLDAAWDIEPARARRALHVAMYAQRIGAALETSLPRRLWMLGLLSVFEEAADEYAVFADYRADERAADIVRVARAFEDAVEAFGRDSSTSPAAAVRWMRSQRERFNHEAVAALGRSLAGHRVIGEDAGAAAKQCAL